MPYLWLRTHKSLLKLYIWEWICFGVCLWNPHQYWGSILGPFCCQTAWFDAGWPICSLLSSFAVCVVCGSLISTKCPVCCNNPSEADAFLRSTGKSNLLTLFCLLSPQSRGILSKCSPWLWLNELLHSLVLSCQGELNDTMQTSGPPQRPRILGDTLTTGL